MVKNKLHPLNVLLLLPLIYLHRKTIYMLLQQEDAILVYGIFVAFIFIFLLWLKRDQLRKAKMELELFGGGIIYTLGYIVLFLSKYYNLFFIEKLSLFVSLFGLLYLLVGKAYIKILFIPLFYLVSLILLFQMQIIEFYSENLHLNLQLITTFVATFFFHLGGIPVFLKWDVITLPHITLIINEGCSGINHVAALLLLCIPLVEIGHKTLKQKLALFIIAFCLAISLNGFRVFLIGLWSYKFGADNLHGPQNIFYVPFVIIVGSILLFFISIKMDTTSKEK
ncbi:MAG: archaeosortase/exosortase family protein [Promethearchaeota archaeon]